MIKDDVGSCDLKNETYFVTFVPVIRDGPLSPVWTSELDLALESSSRYPRGTSALSFNHSIDHRQISIDIY